MVDVDALKDCIEKSGMSKVFISKRTGILRETLHNRLCEKSEFKASEMMSLASVLGLSKSERDRIFFYKEW